MNHSRGVVFFAKLYLENHEGNFVVAFFLPCPISPFSTLPDDRHGARKEEKKGGEEIESDTPASEPVVSIPLDIWLSKGEEGP